MRGEERNEWPGFSRFLPLSGIFTKGPYPVALVFLTAAKL